MFEPHVAEVWRLTYVTPPPTSPRTFVVLLLSKELETEEGKRNFMNSEWARGDTPPSCAATPHYLMWCDVRRATGMAYLSTHPTRGSIAECSIDTIRTSQLSRETRGREVEGPRKVRLGRASDGERRRRRGRMADGNEQRCRRYVLLRYAI